MENITSFSRSRLKINCRNTINITKEIENVTNTKYKILTNQIDGIPVNHFTYNNDDEQIEKVENLLSSLRSEKVKTSDIIILSAKKYEESIVNKLKTKIDIYNPSVNSDKNISFSTIHSFKGLEKKIVIITDVENYKETKLLYIGFSRARTALYVFETKKAAEERADILVSRI